MLGVPLQAQVGASRRPAPSVGEVRLQGPEVEPVHHGRLQHLQGDGGRHGITPVLPAQVHRRRAVGRRWGAGRPAPAAPTQEPPPPGLRVGHGICSSFPAMGMPTDLPIIDTMIGFPSQDRREVYKFLAPELRDEESGTFKMPAQYMFKDIPAELEEGVDPVAVTLYNMDRFGVERAMTNVGNPTRDEPRRAAREHPDRFLPSLEVDPRNGMDEVRAHQGLPPGVRPGVGQHLPRGVPHRHQRGALLPHLRHLRGARAAHLHHRRRARAPGPAGTAEGGVPGRGLLVLPRAEGRHAPRRRAVGGPGGEAHDQVAEPVLLHVRLRPEALPEGDHRLRQHPRRGQDPVRRATSRPG